MKWLLATAVIALLTGADLADGAFAQTAPPANPNASTPAIANPKASNPGAPAVGANSFTEAQAESRIEEAGYPTFPVWSKTKTEFGEARLLKEAQLSTLHSTIKVTL